MLGFNDLLNLFSTDIEWNTHKAAVFRYSHGFCYFHAIERLPKIDAQKLIGVKENYELLENNTRNFCENSPAANALLWGARGCGKSSIVKAVCYEYANKYPNLRVLEVESKDIAILPLLFDCMRLLREYKFIVFCDDLTFNTNTSTYHGLKSTLDGSMEATSRKYTHICYFKSAAFNARKGGFKHAAYTRFIHEVLALSDRFPLQIGFYDNGQKEYLEILEHLIREENSDLSQEMITCIMQEISKISKLCYKNWQ